MTHIFIIYSQSSTCLLTFVFGYPFTRLLITTLLRRTHSRHSHVFIENIHISTTHTHLFFPHSFAALLLLRPRTQPQHHFRLLRQRCIGFRGIGQTHQFSRHHVPHVLSWLRRINLHHFLFTAKHLHDRHGFILVRCKTQPQTFNIVVLAATVPECINETSTRRSRNNRDTKRVSNFDRSCVYW